MNKGFWRRVHIARCYGAGWLRAMFIAFGNSPDDWNDYVRLIFGVYLFGGAILVAFLTILIEHAHTWREWIGCVVVAGCLIHYFRQRPTP